MTANSKQEKRSTEPCYVCEKPSEELLTYSGFPVGSFCSQHRPDKDPAVKTIKDILSRFKKPNQLLPVIPTHIGRMGHPFREAARSMVKKNIAVWQINSELNRAQRRALMRGK